MSIESLDRTSNVNKDPSQVINTRLNVDVLKRRLIDQKKKDKFRSIAIVSSVFVSAGLLSFIIG
ncbi:hypothetical protein IDH35_03445 [Pelagibacterales bacterium SAG-MED49]|nr:hypothetical protein [Pelagibacterales bacterium SAG-MED49]